MSNVSRFQEALASCVAALRRMAGFELDPPLARRLQDLAEQKEEFLGPDAHEELLALVAFAEQRSIEKLEAQVALRRRFTPEELRAQWNGLRVEIDMEIELIAGIAAICKGRAQKAQPKPATIQHEILGELTYHGGHLMGWAGYILLPPFTRTYDKETFEAIQKHESEDSWRYQSARRYPEGMLRLLIKATEGDEPSPEQVRSFQHLVENEAEVYRKVLAALVDCDARESGPRKPEEVAAEVIWEEVAFSWHSTSKGLCSGGVRH